MSKKFDFVFGNPPYDGRSSLHQKIFNKVISLVKDNGYVVFIQPASPYQNKNSDDSNDKEMISNVISYKSSVRFYPGTVFEAAQVGTDVAVTTLQKTKSIPVINKLTYKNGNTYLKVKIDDVTLSEFSPEMYSSIFVKFKNICEKLGSLKDNITQDLSKERVFISKGRGHPNSDDFFTIVPKKNSRIHYNDSENFKYGVLIPKKHAENFYDYCESYVARMGLALNKFNVNLAIGGSTKFVPMCDFSRTYTDEELYQMVGLTEEEINAIENFLPDYYGRKA